MSEKRILVLAVLVVAVFALMAGCTSQSKTVKAGDNVSVDYALWVGDNTTIIETSNATLAKQAGIYDAEYDQLYGYNPLSFVVGEQQFLADIENATIGMKAGESKNITILPSDDIYGAVYDPLYIQPANMSDMIEANITPYVNMTLYSPYFGQARIDRIEINESDYNQSQVYIDYNHPLAGKVLHFMITLRSIEPAKATAKVTG